MNILPFVFAAMMMANEHDATAVRTATPEERAIMEYEYNGDVAFVLAFTSNWCGPLDTEPCYIIVHGDLTIEVGP